MPAFYGRHFDMNKLTFRPAHHKPRSMGLWLELGNYRNSQEALTRLRVSLSSYRSVQQVFGGCHRLADASTVPSASARY